MEILKQIQIYKYMYGSLPIFFIFCGLVLDYSLSLIYQMPYCQEIWLLLPKLLYFMHLYQGAIFSPSSSRLIWNKVYNLRRFCSGCPFSIHPDHQQNNCINLIKVWRGILPVDSLSSEKHSAYLSKPHSSLINYFVILTVDGWSVFWCFPLQALLRFCRSFLFSLLFSKLGHLWNAQPRQASNQHLIHNRLTRFCSRRWRTLKCVRIQSFKLVRGFQANTSVLIWEQMRIGARKGLKQTS